MVCLPHVNEVDILRGMVSGRMSLEISDPTSRVPPLSHLRDRFIAVSPKKHLIILMMHSCRAYVGSSLCRDFTRNPAH